MGNLPAKIFTSASPYDQNELSDQNTRKILDKHTDTQTEIALFKLPQDILRFGILRYLDHRDVSRLSRTCVTALRILSMEEVWKQLFLNRFEDFPRENEDTSWKKLLFERLNWTWTSDASLFCKHCSASEDHKTFWTRESGAWYCAGLKIPPHGRWVFTFKIVATPGDNTFSPNIMFGVSQKFNFNEYRYPGTGSSGITINLDSDIKSSKRIPYSLGAWLSWEKNEIVHIVVDNEKKSFEVKQTNLRKEDRPPQKNLPEFKKEGPLILVCSLLNGAAVQIVRIHRSEREEKDDLFF